MFAIQQEFPMFSDRTEVVINGVRLLLTDDQMGDLYVDITPEQIEVLKLELARERGVPEPILYEDEQATYSSQVDESVLAMVVELQLRMDNGMGMINALTTYKKELDEGIRPRIPMSEYQKVKDKLASYWNHWRSLRDEVSALVKGDKAIWAAYFQIEDKEQWLNEYASQVISKYFTNGDTTEVDEQQSLHQDHSELMEELLRSDLEDREE